AAMVQETFLAPFHMPLSFLPATTATALPTLPTGLSCSSSYSQQSNSNSAATLLQLQQLQPYLTMLLASAANRDRCEQFAFLQMPSPIEGDIIKPIALMPQFAIAHQAATVPLVTSPTAAATFPTVLPPLETLPAAVSPPKSSNTRNKLGRSYNPGRPLAMEDRRRILDLYEQGHKISHIARQIGVTHSCVSKIMSRFRRTGSMQPRSFAAAQQPAGAGPAPLSALLAPNGATVAPIGPLHATLLALQSAAAGAYPMDMQTLIKEEDSDSEHVSVDDGGTETSKCDSPLSRLSISPSSAFSPLVRKNSPTYSIE
ncbi:hypothetical protein PFISCL1PPCAC_4517, partial [Pristionchus fissidentatus]